MTGIAEFRRLANTQTQMEPEATLVRAGDDRIGFAYPVKSPDRWTHFLASISGWPVIGDWNPMHDARRAVEANRQDAAAHEILALRCLAGFVNALHETYGAEIANLCVRDCDLSGLTPLTARVVAQALAIADREQAAPKAINDAAIERFLSVDNGRNSLGMTAALHEVLAPPDSPPPSPGGTPWVERIGRWPAKFVVAHVWASLQRRTDYADRLLSENEIEAAVRKALRAFREIAQADSATERLTAIFADVLSLADPDAMCAKAAHLAQLYDAEVQPSKPLPDSAKPGKQRRQAIVKKPKAIIAAAHRLSVGAKQALHARKSSSRETPVAQESPDASSGKADAGAIRTGRKSKPSVALRKMTKGGNRLVRGVRQVFDGKAQDGGGKTLHKRVSAKK